MTSPIPGNWTSIIQNIVNGRITTDYQITNEDNPVPGCAKDFTASYHCGNDPIAKRISIQNALGKTATFDCSTESKTCGGFKLTIGDNGNLILTDYNNVQIWSSNTFKVGVANDNHKAINGKYKRNFLLAGEMLGIGEFIGSPTGNCYLIMDTSSTGNGLKVKYSSYNCDENQFGLDENTNGLFSMVSSKYNSLINDSAAVSNKTSIDGKTLNSTNAGYNKYLSDFNVKNAQYIKQSKVSPKLKYDISQLSAMEEDRMLVATQYRYNKTMWLIVFILVIVGIIKVIK
jgi:hypothetical protein